MNLREPIVYFAGVAQHSWCDWFNGLNVLESFANPLDGQLERYRPTFASMALDPGAYSNLTARQRGEKDVVTIEGFIDFATQHGDFYAWCASFDDITGGAEGNRRNWERCREADIPRLMPVFHQGEPWSLLEEYLSSSKYVGLGFQRPIDQAEAPFWLDACFSRVPEGTWVHGFAMTAFVRWPFTSVDSTTWLHEVLAMEKESGQGRSALAYQTKRELLEIVQRKYLRQWKWDLHKGVIGVAAGRGQQIHLEEAMPTPSDGA